MYHTFLHLLKPLQEYIWIVFYEHLLFKQRRFIKKKISNQLVCRNWTVWFIFLCCENFAFSPFSMINININLLAANYRQVEPWNRDRSTTLYKGHTKRKNECPSFPTVWGKERNIQVCHSSIPQVHDVECRGDCLVSLLSVIVVMMVKTKLLYSITICILYCDRNMLGFGAILN